MNRDGLHLWWNPVSAALLAIIFIILAFSLHWSHQQDEQKRLLQLTCQQANETAKVWQGFSAALVTAEKASNDPPDVKAARIARYSLLRFPTFNCDV